MVDKLHPQRRLSAALAAVGASTSGTDIFRELEAAYAQPHRHYHTLAHVEACLGWLDWGWALSERPWEIVLALWFHDCVYDPLRSDNEAQSALLAERALLNLGVNSACVARICRMIHATASHAGAEGDVGLLLDIDLHVLGSDTEAFARFEQQVREEYAAFSTLDYARGRSRVLGRILAQKPLYNTDFMRAELEQRARHNLSQALEKWREAACV